MKISGLQKLTLLDFPGHTACTVFTSACNFRCPFCHNASLVLSETSEEISLGEFFDFLESRRGILDGVAITGGEPTLQEGLYDFVKEISSRGFGVKLDSNGYRPEILKELLDSGFVSYVAMDIKSSPEGYAKTAGLASLSLDKIEKSIEIIRSSGVPHEFRTTAVKGLHSFADFVKIGKWLRGADNYFIQQYKDSGDVLSPGYSAFSKEEMTTLLAAVRMNIPRAQLRGVE